MMLRHRATAVAFALALFAIGHDPASASQGSGCMPTTGTVSGLAFAQDANAAIAALISSNSGASAPATDCTAVAIKGQVWLDTSTTPNVLKQYDGSSWVILGMLDGTNHIWTPPLGGGIATLASASTVDLGSVPQAYVSVTGSTGPITSFGSSAVAGTLKVVTFAATPTVTYNATSMILPGGTDLTAAAGDVWIAAYLGSGDWRVISIQQASGQAVVNPAIPVGGKIDYFGFNAPAKYVFGYGQALSRSAYPDYLAAVTSTQSAIRTSGSAILTVSDTSQYNAGMNIEGTGIPAGATVGSTTSTTITMASTCGTGSSACNASNSGTDNITVFAYGYGAGGSTSTVGVPDCRDKMVIARGDMGGTDAGLVTAAGSGTDATKLGITGGLQASAITQGQLPNTSPTFHGAPATITVTSSVGDILENPSGVQVSPSGTGWGVGSGSSGVGGYSITSSGNYTPGGTIDALGSGTPYVRMNPFIVANCIIRVLSLNDPGKNNVPINVGFVRYIDRVRAA